ncbi:hypothetical protein J4E86_006634 [Alternaria arbusti]|uniref:uncharacterized protein n=1 Tax=Alternaria arbusti TaxID=232088 RepID=UPI002220CCE6|nr:uncharacterized protein J4E86_006634 [Alternaria arbusti]KAI4953095.1 hypothetical protein J4E86_006634 [Alternaria arbusti]
MSAPWSESAPRRKANYKVRFRHGVYPDLESQATRADIKKYDYFFGAAQRWVVGIEEESASKRATHAPDESKLE